MEAQLTDAFAFDDEPLLVPIDEQVTRQRTGVGAALLEVIGPDESLCLLDEAGQVDGAGTTTMTGPRPRSSR
jgi:hypothetical protein